MERDGKIFSLLTCLLLLMAGPCPASNLDRTVTFHIAAQSLDAALLEFSKQANVQVVIAADSVGNVRSQALSVTSPARAALGTLLENTGFSFVIVGDTVSVVPSGRATGNLSSADAYGVRLASAQTEQQKNAQSRDREVEEDSKGIPEIMVRSSKTLNMDIQRSQDDVQPYVVFDQDTIRHSGATNLENFLMRRLTMNTSARPVGQYGITDPGTPITLRGFSANQTLLLVDGHRLPSVVVLGAVQQPNLNWIPLTAIQRIEVLPTTASGIYGGGATGGVINVILRRDYDGAEVNLSYDNSFDTDSAIRRIDLGFGRTFNEGRTSILVAPSYSDTNVMVADDRPFYESSRYRIWANNPGYFLNSPTPPVGATTNIRSANGSNLVLKNGTALNSPITFIPAGYAGTSVDQGAALVPNAGRYNLDSANTRQSVLNGLGGGQSNLLGGPRLETVVMSLRHRLTSKLEAFLELGAANQRAEYPSSSVTGSYTVAASAPNNPFLNQDISISAPSYWTKGQWISPGDVIAIM